MGGHGGLNILPQKRWNVYNFDNREKVRQDEEAAAKEEQLKREQSRKRDAEFRLEQLRTARGLAPVSQGKEPAAMESNPAAVDSKSAAVGSKSAAVESKPGHINLFEGIKFFDPIKGLENEGGEGKDGFKKNKKMKKEEAKPRVVTAEDEKYRLGYGVAGKGVKLPWYLDRLSADANEESAKDDESSRADKEKKNKSGKKTLEELREERLEREKREKERERTLILNKSRKDGAAFKDRGFYRSWVEVTHSSLTGNEMQLQEMWSLIHTNFLEKIGGKRTKESMSSRWKLLSQSFSTWRDALAQASSNIRSGENYSDQELQAQAWYAVKTKSKNKSFNRWECWNIVKDCPKFRVVSVGPEVHMNSTPLHSTPDHVHEDDAEEVPETPLPEQASGSTRYPISPQGKKASKRKWDASKNDYAKFMEELTRQGELTLAREMAKDEADKAREAAKAAAVEREFYANERERELLRQEREHVREERRAQQDREIMNMFLEGKSPNSKFFWKSEKADVVRRRRARETIASQGGSSTAREDHPSSTNWLSDDE